MSTPEISASALLESLEGVCYFVDRAGRIAAVGAGHCDCFAAENDTPQLSAQSVLGRPLLDFIGGDAVKESYALFQEILVSEDPTPISFTYRCDAPAIHREMRLCLSPVRDGARVRGVLFQNLVIREMDRPRINLFDPARLLREAQIPPGAVITTLCSYCHAVKWTDGTWILPEDYYRRGGDPDTFISHGICPDCHARLVAPRLGKAGALHNAVGLSADPCERH